METKIITLNRERPKTREELRMEKQERIITGLSLVVLILAIIICLMIFTFLMPRTAQAAQDSDKGALLEASAVQAVAYIESVQSPEEGQTEAPEIDQEELELLALVIYQEAGGDSCSDDTRRMVAEVALNRVADDRFPDTLEDVLLQEGQYGRLSWTGIRWPDRAELPQEANAVARAYRIAEEVLTTTERLLPEDTIFQSEYQQGTEVVAYVDGIYFCR